MAGWDPIGELGGYDLYGFAGNSPVAKVDTFGLRLWYCTTPTTMLGGLGRHGYVWNDDPSAGGDYSKRSCGQEGCSGSKTSSGSTPTRNTGPVRGSGQGEYGDGGWMGTQTDGRQVECTPSTGSDNDADSAAFMQSCNDTINDNLWFPVGCNCHNNARKALRRAGYTLPIPASQQLSAACLAEGAAAIQSAGKAAAGLSR